MLNLKTLSSCFCLVLFFSLFNAAQTADAQNLSVVYDGRADAKGSKPSNAEAQLTREQALPAARQFWGNSNACMEGFEIIDAASGSFTRAGANQRAILYRFCVTGHNFANNGIVIIEEGKIVSHLLYEGGEDNSIGALADVNNNGLSEIILGNGSTNQGYTVSVITVIEISPTGVKKFGIADVYEDDCGAREKCRMMAYKISARPGPTPAFFREPYRKINERWTKAGSSVRYALRKNEVRYELLN